MRRTTIILHIVLLENNILQPQLVVPTKALNKLTTFCGVEFLCNRIIARVSYAITCGTPESAATWVWQVAGIQTPPSLSSKKERV
jgi:hypothetical protein